MHPMLNIAVRAARSAGNLIMRYLPRLETLTVTTKQPHDFVTEVDRMAEEEIIYILHKAYPDHSIQGEEGGAYTGQSAYTWIIDPLDGTTNFLHGYPQFSVSIALTRDGELDQAVVYDPVNNELFTASRGVGAQFENKRIRVSRQIKLDDALLGTGFPIRDQHHLDTYLQTFKALFTDTAGIRRAGSAALDLAYVACGRLDGFWEIGLSPWDMAAGVLLVKEAGGFVTDFGGGDQYMTTGNIVAGTPKVNEAILARIQPLLPEALRR